MQDMRGLKVIITRGFMRKWPKDSAGTFNMVTHVFLSNGPSSELGILDNRLHKICVLN